MALSAKLQMRQSQSLVMTPQLMQSIKLLQMTHLELSRFIDEEIERNPLLVRDETDDAASGPVERRGQGDGEAGSEASGGAEGDDWMARDLAGDAETIAGRLDTSLENMFPDDPGRGETLSPDLQAQWRSAPAGGQAPGSDGNALEAIAAARPTLRDHVGEQIAFTIRGRADLAIAAELADTLDEAGYMRGNCAEIAERLGVRTADVEAVLERCQTFDPAGLFARDLPECLAIQLAARDRLDPAMAALVDRLDLLARRDFAALKQICGVDEEDLVDMLAEIRSLDPKPGTAFTSDTASQIVPDVEVSPAADGSWTIELNADALPRVLVDQPYLKRVSKTSASQEDREFLSNCLQNANWLTRSLDQRAKTILKVAGEIVRRQDQFLLHGIAHLKPMTLKTVADAIQMHESTVSRVTANKYMATPRGVFELRYFFSAAIAASDDGDAHSSAAVRHRIRELIEAESPETVLSDDAIVDILRDGNIDIARRTVAKYRESMNIPSSVRRRREKRALAAAGR
ncbi:MAG: RNA polymerase factor sigma-54 [Rhizobiaceae bacterium]